MSTTKVYSFSQKKCWSCENYAGYRRYNSGFFGDSFEVSEKGQCLAKKGNNRDGSTLYSWYCSRYRRAGDVEAIIESEKAKKANEQAARAARESESARRAEERRAQEEERRRRESAARAESARREAERKSLEEERQRLESERKRLERERWLSDLPSEARATVLARERKERERLSEAEEELQAAKALKLQASKELDAASAPLEKKKKRLEETQGKVKGFVKSGIALVALGFLFAIIALAAILPGSPSQEFTNSTIAFALCLLTPGLITGSLMICLPLALKKGRQRKIERIEAEIETLPETAEFRVALEIELALSFERIVRAFALERHSWSRDIVESDVQALADAFLRASGVKWIGHEWFGVVFIVADDIEPILLSMIAEEGITDEEAAVVVKALEALPSKAKYFVPLKRCKEFADKIAEIHRTIDFSSLDEDAFRKLLDGSPSVREAYLLRFARMESALCSFSKANERVSSEH